ncbi:MAG: prolyl aminopeptidase [archaeon]|nr:prolyl aminopeptidase [archaeon]
MKLKLFPKIKPYKKGYLQVSNLHKIYYHLYGNPKAKPVLFLHGGPGGGTKPKHARYFNPKKYNIILFDQRGSAKSKPFASIKENNIWHLVNDINKLLDFLRIKKTFIWGGSWGSTLALVYAINFPERVAGMLLRGIFLSRKKDYDFFYHGGTKEFFPEIWERFSLIVPKYQQHRMIDYYLDKMQNGSKKERHKFAYEWALYEMSLVQLKTNWKEIKQSFKDYSWKSLAVLEAYYMKHHCFLQENYIINHIKRIDHIPITIAHGRYDFICLPSNAWELHSKMKKSKLFFTIAGHGSTETETLQKLMAEMKRLENKKW